MVENKDDRRVLYTVCSVILVGILVFVWASAPPTPSRVSNLNPGCTMNNPSCGTGLSCINNQCVLSCKNNLCSAELSCINNICVQTSASTASTTDLQPSADLADKYNVGDMRTIDSHTVSLEQVVSSSTPNTKPSAIVTIDQKSYQIDEGKSLTVASNDDESTVLRLYKVATLTADNSPPEEAKQLVSDSHGRQLRILRAEQLQTNEQLTEQINALKLESKPTEKLVVLTPESAYLEVAVLKRKIHQLTSCNCGSNSVCFQNSCQMCSSQESGNGIVSTSASMNVSNYTFSWVGSEAKTVILAIGLAPNQIGSDTIEAKTRIKRIEIIEEQPNQPPADNPDNTTTSLERKVVRALQAETLPGPQNSLTVTVSEGQSVVTAVGNVLITVTANSVDQTNSNITVTICHKVAVPLVAEPVFNGGLLH